MTPAIELIDVTVRDALQRVPHFMPTEDKAALARALAQAGFRRLEVTAFRPDALPQFADASALLRSLNTVDATWRALCYHTEGVHAALSAGAKEIAVNVGTTDAFEQRFHRTEVEALGDGIRGVRLATQAGVRCVASISHGLGGVFDDEAFERLVRVTDPLVEAGASELTLADTAGECSGETGSVFYCAVATRYPGVAVTLHFHEGRATALENIADAVLGGCSRFEVGLGPHASPQSGDNVSPVDVVHYLDALPLSNGLNPDALRRAQSLLSAMVAKAPIMT